jgi:hypothetical protein
MLIAVLSCRDNRSQSGPFARIAGQAIGASHFLPNMATAAFLSCLSRSALETAARDAGVNIAPRAKDTRSRMVSHFQDGTFVYPGALFPLTVAEQRAFAERAETGHGSIGYPGEYIHIPEYGQIRGMPKPRSATMLRWISFVPPAIVPENALMKSNIGLPNGSSASSANDWPSTPAIRTMKEQIRWRNTVEDSFTIDGNTLAEAPCLSLSASTRRNKRRAACISARKLMNSRWSCASRSQAAPVSSDLR